MNLKAMLQRWATLQGRTISPNGTLLSWQHCVMLVQSFSAKLRYLKSGMALETVSNLWGRTVSPFNRDLGAGGSSGGDATLIGLRGSPIAPSTDMGGSIRVPAAFNRLYGIRPTSDRILKGGMQNTNTGNLTIKLSCGPVCHSLDDLELLTKILNAHPNNEYDVTYAPVP